MQITLCILYKYYTSNRYNMVCSSGKYLGDIEQTEIGEDGIFNGDYVKEVKSACGALFADMCHSSGVDCSLNLTSNCLNKPSITKAQLVVWLTATVYLLNSCSVPLMELIVEQKAELDELKSEKIVDQNNITRLQEQLIEQKNEELNTVKKIMLFGRVQ